MTKKEIIIGGVDVSKCKYAYISEMKRPKINIPFLNKLPTYTVGDVKCKLLEEYKQEFFCHCYYGKNCYYKQLQRMEKGYTELMEENARILAKLEKAEFENRILQRKGKK